MRVPALAVALALGLAAAAGAQSPLSMASTLPSNGGGSIGGVLWFDLVVHTTVALQQIDVNSSSPAGQSGTVEVWLYCGRAAWTNAIGAPQDWYLAASGPVVAAGLDALAPCVLTTPLALGPGSYAVALRHVGITTRYTTGTGTGATFANAELSLVAGGASNTLFPAQAPFQPRLFNGRLHYAIGGTPVPCAQRGTFGSGCSRGASSFYEQFADLAAFDLGGAPGAEVVLRLLPRGAAGYEVVSAPPRWFAPRGQPLAANSAVPAPMGDDSLSVPLALPQPFPVATGPTASVQACSNGYLLLDPLPAASGSVTATATTLLASPGERRFAVAFADWHPQRNATTHAGAGVYFDVDPADNALCYVTWLDVGEFANPVAGGSVASFQVLLDSRTGELEFRYGRMQRAVGTSDCIVGWSHGLQAGVAAVDPGSVDLSAVVPLRASGPDRMPLRLDADRPVLGTTIAIVVDDVPAESVVNLLWAGTTAIAPPDTVSLQFLGMPGCFLHLLQPSVLAIDLGTTPTWSWPLVLPAVPSWVGRPVYLQAASLLRPGSGVNALGAVASNGLALVPGFD